MATRSTIAVLLEDGSVHQVYAHWDGYLSHNGAILDTHYNDLAIATELVSLGDISVLGAAIDPGDDPHSFDMPAADVTVYYGRDRGEVGVGTKRFTSFAEYRNECNFQHYNYIFMNDQWFFTTNSAREFNSVRDALHTQEKMNTV